MRRLRRLLDVARGMILLAKSANLGIKTLHQVARFPGQSIFADEIGIELLQPRL